MDVSGHEFVLGPPQHVVSFDAETIPSDVIAKFRAPWDIYHCYEVGECLKFGDYRKAWIREFKDSKAVVNRGDGEFRISLPDSAIIDSEAAEYAAAYMAYANGDHEGVLELTDRYINEQEGSPAKIDVHLYRAASLARMGDLERAKNEIRNALEINPLARRSLRYGIMVELAAEGAANEVSDEYFKIIMEHYGPTSMFDHEYEKFAR